MTGPHSDALEDKNWSFWIGAARLLAIKAIARLAR